MRNQLKNRKEVKMKKDVIVEILRVLGAIIAAAITALSVSSCMGLKIKGSTEYEYNKAGECKNCPKVELTE